jgi:hypothetical protein
MSDGTYTDNSYDAVERPLEPEESLSLRQRLFCTDPFSDPPTILEPPARGRTKTRPNNQAKMDQEIQEIRIAEPGRKPSRSVAGTG